MTLIKTIKNIIEACCGKLDVMEAEINKQNAKISSLQEQVEMIKTTQTASTVLLEEILFTVSEPQTPDIVPQEEKVIIKNLVQNKVPHGLN